MSNYLTLIGHGNCAQIPPISSYDMAKAHYEKVKPIRGRAVETKPLGRKRRFPWMTIEKNTVANQSEGTEYHTYACQLFSTHCVEFFPNGDITLRTNGWSSITTGSFINFVMWDLGKLVSASGKWYFLNNRNEAIRFDGSELKLKLDNGVVVPKVEPTQEHKYTVNRKALNALRKKYASVIEYGKSMLAIDHTFDRLELENSKLGMTSLNLIPQYNWVAPHVPQNRANVFRLMDEQMKSGDLELLYDIARYVATSAGRYSYRMEKFVCYPQNFVKMFDELFKYEFKDQVFNAEPVALGVIFDDRNKRYFKY
jgi:hypothetical protein